MNNKEYPGGAVVITIPYRLETEEKVLKSIGEYSIDHIEDKRNNDYILYLVCFVNTDKRSRFLDSLENYQAQFSLIDSWDQISDIWNKFTPSVTIAELD